MTSKKRLNTKRLALAMAGALCLAGSAQAGKLADLLNSASMKDAGSTAITGLTLTDAQVVDLGAKSVAQMDKENPVADANDAYAKRLAKLSQGMEREDGMQLNFKVYLVKDVNAFAVPDGSVRVFAGLMDLMPDDAELMSVIGHEIGHVKYGHSKEHYRRVPVQRRAQGRGRDGRRGGQAGGVGHRRDRRGRGQREIQPRERDRPTNTAWISCVATTWTRTLRCAACRSSPRRMARRRRPSSTTTRRRRSA